MSKIDWDLRMSAWVVVDILHVQYNHNPAGIGRSQLELSTMDCQYRLEKCAHLGRLFPHISTRCHPSVINVTYLRGREQSAVHAVTRWK